MKLVLGLETSCDDSSAALVDETGFVRCLRSMNQDDSHRIFGGVVPEIASRNHTEQLLPLVDEVLREAGVGLKDLDGVSVTSRPGLVGSLLVGLLTGKTLAWVSGKPFVAVNHQEGHLLAPFLRDGEYKPAEDFNPPYLALTVSGGHTHLFRILKLRHYELLGQSVDDAAGEAFDKFAKMVGLGFPGGVRVDACAQRGGRPEAFEFPRPKLRDEGYDFSFSGLKTSALRRISQMSKDKIQNHLPDLCASFQEAVVDCLLERLEKAVVGTGIRKLIVTGGVSANSRLRFRLQNWCQEAGLTLLIPPSRYCTDNAAMIAWAGLLRFRDGLTSPQGIGPSARSLEGDFLNSLERLSYE